MPRVPPDHPVKQLRHNSPGKAAVEKKGTLAFCGTCGRYWDDGIATSMTPVPAGRCPFEYYHPKPQERPRRNSSRFLEGANR